MSPDALALTSTLLAWRHADWTWVWGGLMIVICTTLIVAVVWLLVTPTGRYERPPTDVAREILAERHARGEISDEEYDERIAALRPGAGGSSTPTRRERTASGDHGPW